MGVAHIDYTFDLIDEGTLDYVKGLGKTVNVAKDRSWNNKNISAQLLQGILGGESIPNIAKRLANVESKMANTAIKNARTMTTAAENKGRLAGMNKASQDGVVMKKMWIATHDSRTRDSHAAIDGEKIDIDKTFSNGLEEPADPDGAPSEVYNCRCTMTAVVVGFNGANGFVGVDSDLGNYTNEANEYWADKGDKEEKKVAKEKEAKETKPIAIAYDYVSATKMLIEDTGFSNLNERQLKKLNDENFVQNANQLNKLEQEFGAIHNQDTVRLDAKTKKNVNAYVETKVLNTKEETLVLEVSTFARSVEEANIIQKKHLETNWCMPYNEGKGSVYAVTHEYGHILEYNEIYKRNTELFDSVKEFANIKNSSDLEIYAAEKGINPYEASIAFKKAQSKALVYIQEMEMNIFDEVQAIGKEKFGEDFRLFSELSRYGMSSRAEGFAEMFANSQLGKPNKAGECMVEWLGRNGYGN